MWGFFIDSLELFRREVLGHESSFVLAGHSLGGLLSAQYALKYPKAVEGLILISPAGLNAQPNRERHASIGEVSWGYRLAKFLLALNFTPQDIVRLAAWKGPGLVSSVIDRRFGQRWPAHERDMLADYLYHITVAPPCGEFALHSILEAVVYKPDSNPKHPEVNEFIRRRMASSASSGSSEESAGRAPTLKVGIFAREPLFSSMDKLSHFQKPILVIYGDTDWLRYPGVEEDIRRWRENQGVDTSLSIISNAGHHLYLDNPKEFHAEMFTWLKRKNLLSR